jgi:DNA transposition AAA+ family ATPase
MSTRESSAALKITYINALDPKNQTPEQVRSNITEAVHRGDFALKDIAKFTGFAPPTISQVLKGDYEGDTDKVVNALMRFWKNWLAKHSIIQTNAATEIQQLLAWAFKRKLIGVVTGDNGRGKTTAVQAYCAANPDDTAYLVLDQTTHIIDALNAIANALGIEAQMNGPASFRKAAIIRALQRKPRLIIIDEADEIKPRLLSILRTIYGDNDGRCGIVFVGTTKLERMLKHPANDLRYMDTRISLRRSVPEMDESDAIKLINEYEHDLERAEMREMLKWANTYSRNQGGIRALRNLMNIAQDVAQSEEKSEIDIECINQAKGYL